MPGKLHLICMKTEGIHAKIRCYLNDISYLSETQKMISILIITTSLVILSPEYFCFYYVFLKIMFPVDKVLPI